MYEFLTTLNFSPDIVCLTETRIKSQPLINVEIPNYSFVHVDSESAAGGLAIYVSDRFQFELQSNHYHLIGIECLWLNIYESNSKKKLLYAWLIGIQSNLKLMSFIECFSNSLSDLSKLKNVYYILGDYNMNINPDSRTTYVNDYSNFLLSHGAFPLITKSTRVIENSATIIDHIISNDTINVLNPGIIQTDLTDHYPIFCGTKRFHCQNAQNVLQGQNIILCRTLLRRS